MRKRLKNWSRRDTRKAAAAEGALKMKGRSAEGLLVFPNPSEGRIVIRPSTDGTWPATMRLRDVTGKTVHQKRIESEQGDILLDVGYLESGIYILEWIDGNQQLTTPVVIR